MPAPSTPNAASAQGKRDTVKKPLNAAKKSDSLGKPSTPGADDIIAPATTLPDVRKLPLPTNPEWKQILKLLKAKDKEGKLDGMEKCDADLNCLKFGGALPLVTGLLGKPKQTETLRRALALILKFLNTQPQLGWQLNAQFFFNENDYTHHESIKATDTQEAQDKRRAASRECICNLYALVGHKDISVCEQALQCIDLIATYVVSLPSSRRDAQLSILQGHEAEIETIAAAPLLPDSQGSGNSLDTVLPLAKDSMAPKAASVSSDKDLVNVELLCGKLTDKKPLQGPLQKLAVSILSKLLTGTERFSHQLDKLATPALSKLLLKLADDDSDPATKVSALRIFLSFTASAAVLEQIVSREATVSTLIALARKDLEIAEKSDGEAAKTAVPPTSKVSEIVPATIQPIEILHVHGCLLARIIVSAVGAKSVGTPEAAIQTEGATDCTGKSLNDVDRLAVKIIDYCLKNIEHYTGAELIHCVCISASILIEKSPRYREEFWSHDFLTHLLEVSLHPKMHQKEMCALSVDKLIHHCLVLPGTEGKQVDGKLILEDSGSPSPLKASILNEGLQAEKAASWARMSRIASVVFSNPLNCRNESVVIDIFPALVQTLTTEYNEMQNKTFELSADCSAFSSRAQANTSLFYLIDCIISLSRHAFAVINRLTAGLDLLAVALVKVLEDSVQLKSQSSEVNPQDMIWGDPSSRTWNVEAEDIDDYACYRRHAAVCVASVCGPSSISSCLRNGQIVDSNAISTSRSLDENTTKSNVVGPYSTGQPCHCPKLFLQHSKSIIRMLNSSKDRVVIIALLKAVTAMANLANGKELLIDGQFEAMNPLNSELVLHPIASDSLPAASTQAPAAQYLFGPPDESPESLIFHSIISRALSLIAEKGCPKEEFMVGVETLFALTMIYDDHAPKDPSTLSTSPSAASEEVSGPASVYSVFSKMYQTPSCLAGVALKHGLLVYLLSLLNDVSNVEESPCNPVVNMMDFNLPSSSIRHLKYSFLLAKEYSESGNVIEILVESLVNRSETLANEILRCHEVEKQQAAALAEQAASASTKNKAAGSSASATSGSATAVKKGKDVKSKEAATATKQQTAGGADQDHFTVSQGTWWTSRTFPKPTVDSCDQLKAEWLALLNLRFDVERSNLTKVTPLLTALCENHLKIAQSLLRVGVNPNTCDSHGFSPLMAAISNGQYSLVKNLKDAGADFDQQNTDGCNALKLALVCSPSCRAICLQPGCVTERLDDGIPEAVSLILDAEADPNVSDHAGNYLLHLLIEGTDAMVQVGRKRTCVQYLPLTLPSARDWAVRVLTDLLFSPKIKEKLNIDACNKKGRTPLHVAILNNFSEAANLLLRAQCQTNVLDEFQYLPIHYLCAGFCTGSATVSVDCLCKMMLENGNRMPLIQGRFNDDRKTRSKEEKAKFDIGVMLDGLYRGIIDPTALSDRQMTVKDLIYFQTSSAVGTNDSVNNLKVDVLMLLLGARFPDETIDYSMASMRMKHQLNPNWHSGRVAALKYILLQCTGQKLLSQKLANELLPLHTIATGYSTDKTSVVEIIRTIMLSEDVGSSKSCQTSSLHARLINESLVIGSTDIGVGQKVTPLDLAVENCEDICWAFIECGADLSLAETIDSVIEKAIKKGYSLRLIDYLLERRASTSVTTTAETQGYRLWLAACNNRADLLELFIALGYDLGAHAPFTSPLHRAVEEDKGEVARLLIQHGADLLKEDSRGKSSLQLAVELCRLSLIRTLEESGQLTSKHILSTVLDNACGEQTILYLVEYLHLRSLLPARSASHANTSPEMPNLDLDGSIYGRILSIMRASLIKEQIRLSELKHVHPLFASSQDSNTNTSLGAGQYSFATKSAVKDCSTFNGAEGISDEVRSASEVIY